jgi:hypothetical protein
MIGYVLVIFFLGNTTIETSVTAAKSGGIVNVGYSTLFVGEGVSHAIEVEEVNATKHELSTVILLCAPVHC